MRIIQLFFAISIISILFTSCSDSTGCTDPNACNYDPDASIDSGDCESGQTWYEDQDGDGLGNPNSFVSSCFQPDGFVEDNTDDFDLLITNEQRTTIGYVGATWCAPCGERGGPYLSYVHDEVDRSKAVLLRFQTGDLISPPNSQASKFAIDIFQATDAPFIPHSFIGGGSYITNKTLNFDHDTNIAELSQDISSITSQSTRVGIGGTAKLDGNQIAVTAAIKMINPENKRYFVSTYLVEDDVIADQKVGSNQDPVIEPDVVHNDIVRANMDNVSSFKGESIGSNFLPEEIILKDYVITVPTLTSDVAPINTDNVKVVIVIWSGASDFMMENVIAIDVN